MSFRGFIAAELRSVPELERFHGDLDKVGRGLKPVSLDAVHVTLKFLGDVDEALVPDIAKVMAVSVEGVPPFEITLIGSGTFPERGPARVVWVGLEGAEPMSVISERLEDGLERLGYVKEGRQFQPHVTMARVKDPGAAFAAKYASDRYKETDFGKQTVSEILLKRSVLSRLGPEYHTVLAVQLH